MSRKLIIAVAACLVLLLGGGVAWAAGAFRSGTTANTAREPAVYGACVNVKTGYLRVLERNNLSKSRWGACRQDGSERFVSFPSSVAGNLTTGEQEFLSGKGAPAAEVGKVGQFYLDVESGRLYGPKTTEGWGSGFALQGKDGEPGKDGKSAYELWRDSKYSAGTDKSEAAFWRWVRGGHAERSLYQLWYQAMKRYGETPDLDKYKRWVTDLGANVPVEYTFEVEGFGTVVCKDEDNDSRFSCEKKAEPTPTPTATPSETVSPSERQNN